MKKRVPVFHPFLFTLFPIASLYVNNLGQVPFSQAARAFLVAAAAAGGLMALLRLALGD